MSKQPTYGAGLLWIALNDAPADNDNAEQLEGYISVALLADLFGKQAKDVANDVYTLRNGHLWVKTYRSVMAALRAQGMDVEAARAYLHDGILKGCAAFVQSRGTWYGIRLCRCKCAPGSIYCARHAKAAQRAEAQAARWENQNAHAPRRTK